MPALEASNELYPHWRGGYYYAAYPKGDPAAATGLALCLALVECGEAAEFAAIYAKALTKRYLHVHECG